jgi:hypothetical protein
MSKAFANPPYRPFFFFSFIFRKATSQFPFFLSLAQDTTAVSQTVHSHELRKYLGSFCPFLFSQGASVIMKLQKRLGSSRGGRLEQL